MTPAVRIHNFDSVHFQQNILRDYGTKPFFYSAFPTNCENITAFKIENKPTVVTSIIGTLDCRSVQTFTKRGRFNSTGYECDGNPQGILVSREKSR